MVRYFRRSRKPRQNGVNAIFSGKIPREQLRTRSRFIQAKEDTDSGPVTHRSNPDRDTRSRFRWLDRKLPRTLAAIILIVLGFSLITSAIFTNFSSLSVASPGPVGPAPGPVKSIPRNAPSFYAISNIPETLVPSGSSYTGASPASAGDFFVVQVAYSEGSPGNLPDVASVQDTLSGAFFREGSASPGVDSNFWEQVWVARATVTVSSANITVTPDWKDCLAPCVSSIIITMNIAAYRNVAGIGSMIAMAPNASSTSQAANIEVAEPGSVLVELLSHGAYNSCQGDAAQPGSGQISRGCYTGTTERTELFDHLVPSPRAYNESYSWSQPEVQRGIYLVLDGS